jgi:hypothetical protein
MKDWVRELDGKKFGRLGYSQSYQDDLIDEIFKNITTMNDPPFCVEFGFNAQSLTGGSGANVANLVINKGWKSLLLDGTCANSVINLHKYFLTSSNICEIFIKHDVPKCPEYISIDVDSTDLWLFKALLEGGYRAMVYSVEYNSSYPLEVSITNPNDPNERWVGDRAHGASLKALTTVANEHDYSLLWVVVGLDAFFIRNDLVADGTNASVFPFEKWRKDTNRPFHRPLLNEDRLGIFVDYEEFVKSGGDLEMSQRSAFLNAKAFLTDASDAESVKRREAARHSNVRS